MRHGTILAALLIIAGCASPTDHPGTDATTRTPTPPTLTTTATTAPPCPEGPTGQPTSLDWTALRLYAANTTLLTLQGFNETSGRLEVLRGVEFARSDFLGDGIRMLRTGGDRVFVFAGAEIIVFDEDLNELASRVYVETIHGYSPIGGADVTSDHVFVGINGTLHILDHDLQELGRVRPELDTHHRKNLDHITIDQGMAYVVDDVVVPLYLFRIDVSEPETPRVVQRIETTAFQGHLGEQWLDVAARRWYVIEATGGRARSTQSVLVFDMDNGSRLDAGPTWSMQGDALTGANARASGTYLHAVVDRVPAWALGYENGTLHLSRVDFSEPPLRLVPGPGLGIPRESLASDLRPWGHGLVVTAQSHLRLVDTGEPARVVYCQTLDAPAQQFVLA